MVATTWPRVNMDQLVKDLSRQYPDIKFVVGERATWSPRTKEVFYCDSDKYTDTLALIHELGHALSGHNTFKSDVDLLRKEAEAWDRAKELAATHKIDFDESHVQDCLDTYRDWLHRRSTCPTCSAHGVQRDLHEYVCLNCDSTWRVTNSRLCRPYRRSLRSNKNTPA